VKEWWDGGGRRGFEVNKRKEEKKTVKRRK